VVTVGDKAIRPDGEGPGALQANTVTVALKPEDAQKVRLAEKLGELSLLLRKEGDDLKQSAKVTKPDDLLRPAFGQPAAPAAAPERVVARSGDRATTGARSKDRATTCREAAPRQRSVTRGQGAGGRGRLPPTRGAPFFMGADRGCPSPASHFR